LRFPLELEGLLKNPKLQEEAMAGKRSRRRFTPEKAQAVKRVLDGRSLSEVATELGLSTDQLSTWRTEYLAIG
jgi:transposase-like protein